MVWLMAFPLESTKMNPTLMADASTMNNLQSTHIPKSS